VHVQPLGGLLLQREKMRHLFPLCIGAGRTVRSSIRLFRCNSVWWAYTTLHFSNAAMLALFPFIT
jgi:hypothetical protein